MFLDPEPLLPMLNYLLGSHYLLSQAVLDGLRSLQVLDFSSEALIEVTYLAELLSLLKALWEISIDNVQLNFLLSRDLVDCLLRQDPWAVNDDMHLCWDIFVCAKFRRSDAHVGWGLEPAAEHHWLGLVECVDNTDILPVNDLMHVMHIRNCRDVGGLMWCLWAVGGTLFEWYSKSISHCAFWFDSFWILCGR